MANYESRVQSLKQRRQGVALSVNNYDSASYAGLNKAATLKESWETRSAYGPATTYALGAMQEVEKRNTEISIETANRIQNQLIERLSRKGITAESRLQGSVPLNIHIKGVSDVDLLIIDKQMLRYDAAGVKANSYFATSKTDDNILSILRIECADILREAYPAANVDESGSKSLKITGGSLAREVDVVPSIWWDTAEYQSTNLEYYRGIFIYDISKESTIENLPFLHIQRIKDKCEQTYGGLRKSIRLLKNLRAEAAKEGNEINLSSYDIASIMYHADVNNLAQGRFYELAVLSETQRFLDFLWNNFDYAKSLEVPNKTRKIFEKDSQKNEIGRLSHIVDTLVSDVTNEIAGVLLNGASFQTKRVYLNNLKI